MASDAAGTVKASTMAPAVAPPFSISVEWNATNFELLPPRIEDPDTPIRATSDTNTPSSTEGVLHMPPSELSACNNRVLSASLDNPLTTAPPSLGVDIPSTEADEAGSLHTLEPAKSTEAITPMDSSPSRADISTSTSDPPIPISSEKQEEFNSTESLPDTNLSHISKEKYNLLLTETTLTETPGLPFGPFSDEDTREVASPSEIRDAADTLSEPMELCSPEDENMSKVLEKRPDMKSPSLEIGLVDMTSEVNETSSAESPEVVTTNNSPSREVASDVPTATTEHSAAEDGVLSNFQENQPDKYSFSTDAALPDMPSEVDCPNSDELEEVALKVNSAPPPNTFVMPPKASKFKPSGRCAESDFKEDQPSPTSSFLEAGHENMTSVTVEVEPADSAKSIESNHSQLLVEPLNMALCSYSEETAADFAEALEPILKEAIQYTESSEVTNEPLQVKLELLDAKVKIERLETSSTEISELELAGTVSKDESSSILAPENSTSVSRSLAEKPEMQEGFEPVIVIPELHIVANSPREESSSFSTPEDSAIVSDPLEEKSEVRGHCKPAEVISDVDFAPVSADGLDKGLKPVDEDMTDLSDSSLAAAEIAAKETIPVPLNSSLGLDSTLEASLAASWGVQDVQEMFVAENDLASGLDSITSAINHLNNTSTLLHTTANQILYPELPSQNLSTSFPLEATDINCVVAGRSEANQTDMEDQAHSPSNIPLSSPRYSSSKMNSEHVSVAVDTSNVHSVVGQGSEMMQPETANQTHSESTSPLSSPPYNFEDMDYEYMFEKGATKNLHDVNLPDAAVSTMEPRDVESTKTSDSFDSNSPSLPERFTFENPLPNSPEEWNMGRKSDEDKYPGTAMDLEDAGRRSPEIKIEPMAIGDIPYPPKPPSSMESSCSLQKLVKTPSSVVKEEEISSEVSLDTVPFADTKALGTDTYNFNAVFSEDKLEPGTVDGDQGYQVCDTRSEGKSKPVRKRTQFPNEDDKEFQTSPAKKLRHKVDFPQIKKEHGVSGCLDEKEAIFSLVPLPMSSTNDKRTIMSPPSTPPHTEVDQVKMEVISFKSEDKSVSATQRPQGSIYCTIEEQKIVSAATSTPTTILGSTVKKDFANDTIELCIGSIKKCVLVPRHILAKSSFFASLMSKYPNPKKTPEAYHFQDFDAYSLATVIYWLHYGNIKLIAEDYKADDLFDTKHMIKVYCLCVKLQLRSLQNLAIELLGHGYLKNRSAPTIEEIDIAYSEIKGSFTLQFYLATWAQCREHAPLQKYAFAGPWNQKQFRNLCKKHPDLAVYMQGLHESTSSEELKSVNPQFHEICWYHEHLEGELCGVAGLTFETACYGVEFRLSEPI